MIAEIRQEMLDIVEERDFIRGELPEKYIAKVLYSWCYKMRKCGQTLVRTSKIQIVVAYYQSMMRERGHVTRKSHDMMSQAQSGLEELKVQKNQEESRERVTSRDIGSSWCTHGAYMYDRD